MRSNDNPNACTPGKRHYWKIAPAAGQISRGVCKHCGGKRLFKNYMDAPPRWGVLAETRRAAYEGRI